MKDKITSVVIYSENLEKLREYIFKTGETRTKLINRLLEQFFNNEQQINPKDNQVK